MSILSQEVDVTFFGRGTTATVVPAMPVPRTMTSWVGDGIGRIGLTSMVTRQRG